MLRLSVKDVFGKDLQLNGDGGRLYDGNMYFGKTGLILSQKLGQDRTNGLRLPTTIFPFPVLVLDLADAVFHDYGPETVLIVLNTIRLSTPIGSE